MKTPTVTLLAALAMIAGSHAQDYHYVNGGYDKNGKYHDGHYQTNPDGDKNNNWSTSGNRNPFTGERGHEARDRGYGSIR